MSNSVDKTILDSGVIKLALIALVLVLAMFLLAEIFPEDKSVDPVKKDTKEQIDQVDKINKDKPDEKTIPTVAPIGDLPVIKLQQSSEQQTNSDAGESSGNEQESDRYSIESQRIDKKDNRELRYIEQEPAEVEQGGTQTLETFFESHELIVD